MHVQDLTHVQNLSCLDSNVRCLTLGPAQGLMDHNARVGEAFSLALRSGGEEERAHGSGHAKAHRTDFAWNELHCIIDCHASRNRSSGRVDVHRDIRVGICVCQVEHLRDQDLSHLILDLSTQDDDAVFQQLRHHIQLLPAPCVHHRHPHRRDGVWRILPSGIDLRLPPGRLLGLRPPRHTPWPAERKGCHGRGAQGQAGPSRGGASLRFLRGRHRRGRLQSLQLARG
mmetsp:Transcript_23991/g.45269  ORF Transcript_23991/g.45269 Transcript_23991/m.45269 type:complete len:228 (-) Transcript_23991:130-813(-)